MNLLVLFTRNSLLVLYPSVPKSSFEGFLSSVLRPFTVHKNSNIFYLLMYDEFNSRGRNCQSGAAYKCCNRPLTEIIMNSEDNLFFLYTSFDVHHNKNASYINKYTLTWSTFCHVPTVHKVVFFLEKLEKRLNLHVN